MASEVANDIAAYLESIGEGTQGSTITVDAYPDEPDNVVSIFDLGGPPPDEPPENWRELYIQVRSQDHNTGYAQIWRILSAILYPATGVIAVGQRMYTAKLSEMPSVAERDKNRRYIFGFQCSVIDIHDQTPLDPWADAMGKWMQANLPNGWTVYQTTPGNNRPSMFVRLTGMDTVEAASGMYTVTKRFSVRVITTGPNEMTAGAQAVVTGLRRDKKIVLDPADRRYLIVSDASFAADPQALTAGTISITLTRKTNRPWQDAPLIAAVHTSGTIN